MILIRIYTNELIAISNEGSAQRMAIYLYRKQYDMQFYLMPSHDERMSTSAKMMCIFKFTSPWCSWPIWRGVLQSEACRGNMHALEPCTEQPPKSFNGSWLNWKTVLVLQSSRAACQEMLPPASRRWRACRLMSRQDSLTLMQKAEALCWRGPYRPQRNHLAAQPL